MPLYEYQCDACGHRFEIIQKFSDPPVERCPKCGGAVQKLQSAPAFQFKGSGWYITDYAKKDQSASEKAETSSKESASGEKQDAGEKGDKGDKKAVAAKTEKPADKSPSTSDTAPPTKST